MGSGEGSRQETSSGQHSFQTYTLKSFLLLLWHLFRSLFHVSIYSHPQCISSRVLHDTIRHNLYPSSSSPQPPSCCIVEPLLELCCALLAHCVLHSPSAIYFHLSSQLQFSNFPIISHTKCIKRCTNPKLHFGAPAADHHPRPLHPSSAPQLDN